MKPSATHSALLLSACLLLGAIAMRATRAQAPQAPRTLEVYYIATTSMLGTLRPNDRILVDTSLYRARQPRVGEIVLFKAPPSLGEPPDDDWIMRCVGAPGQVVFTRGRQLFRDGRAVREPYVKWSREPGYVHAYDMKIVGGLVYSRDYFSPDSPGVWSLDGVPVSEKDQRRVTRARPEKIPPGKLLVLGDHRNAARDSHRWGLLPRASVLGRATRIFWPLAHTRAL